MVVIVVPRLANGARRIGLHDVVPTTRNAECILLKLCHGADLLACTEHVLEDRVVTHLGGTGVEEIAFNSERDVHLTDRDGETVTEGLGDHRVVQVEVA